MSAARHAAAAPARDRLDERPRPGARRRAARRTARSSPRPSRPPGRGRQGRTWTAPPGEALLMSLVLRDRPRAAAARRRGRGRRDAPATSARIKWPNDVLLDGRKVAGHPRRGPPAGGLGGARHRRQRRGAPATFPPELRRRSRRHARASTRRDVEPFLARAARRAGALARAEPPATCSTPGARATRCAAARSRWAGGDGRARGHRRAGRLRRRARRRRRHRRSTPARSTSAAEAPAQVALGAADPPRRRRRGRRAARPSAPSSRSSTACGPRARASRPAPRRPTVSARTACRRSCRAWAWSRSASAQRGTRSRSRFTSASTVERRRWPSSRSSSVGPAVGLAGRRRRGRRRARSSASSGVAGAAAGASQRRATSLGGCRAVVGDGLCASPAARRHGGSVVQLRATAAGSTP